MGQILHAMLLLIACPVSVSVMAQPAERPPAPAVQDLGDQRYRIGEIEIDKAAGVFRVPGQVLRDTPPLEFLVVTKGGHKAYESLLEVNADAFQFNLACILIGLDQSKATPVEQRDFSQPASGDPVELTVSWTQGDKTITVNGAEMLAIGKPAQKVDSHDWVYTGSSMLAEGHYLADLAGTLVGFVHRGESIIEHRVGIGLGNYGSVAVDQTVTPPVGSPIELTVRRLGGVK
jgi:hypothetical protein